MNGEKNSSGAAPRGSEEQAFRRVDLAARALGLVVVVSLSAATGSGRSHGVALGLIAALAVAGAMPLRNWQYRRWRPLVESLLAGLIIASATPFDPALLPYIVVPCLSAGFIGGWRWAVTAAGASSLGLMCRPLITNSAAVTSDYLVSAAQWSVLALSVGLLAAWVRKISVERTSDVQVYEQASRLLEQLRDVARRLPAGLDRVALAEQTLGEVQKSIGFDAGVMCSVGPTGILTTLAQLGQVELDSDNIGDLDPRYVSSWQQQRTRAWVTDVNNCRGVLVLPLAMGNVTGVVVLQRRATPFLDTETDDAQAVVKGGAVRMEAASLYDELRDIATAQERRRLAREIHDGIAQELASLGYAVDDLKATALSPGSSDLQLGLTSLRSDLTRVISELRLSIFDLRSEIGPSLTLPAALAEHARTVGNQCGIVVHLDLAEAPVRLPRSIETELLRIAQEAMANARRHSGARNLWITCHVAPPSATVVIEDDGLGWTSTPPDRFGLEIMRERAAHIGARLEITERRNGGVRVAAMLGEGFERGATYDDARASRR